MFKNSIKSGFFSLIFIFLFMLITEVMACGPNFPERLLLNRKVALLDQITGNFDVDIHQLIPKGKETTFFTTTTSEFWEGEETPRERLEKKALSTKQFNIITLMRAAKDADNAYRIGKKLPEAIRAYTAGAVAYHLKQFSNATTYFNTVLAQKDKMRRVWATYMLAKIARKNHQEEVAKRGFQQVRTLVMTGYPDPLELAVSSYGEEARLFYEALDYPTAFSLYAKQVSYGSGSDSLRLLLSKLMDETPKVIEHTLIDAFSRNLILLYAHTHFTAYDKEDYYSDEEREEGKERNKKEENFLATVIKKTLEQSAKDQIFQLKGAGWLAANRYAVGDFELAHQLVKFDKNALSQWVKAKLALRNGQLNEGYTALSDAIKHFPLNAENTVQYKRLHAERGILELERKNYQQALQVFYSATNGVTYWGDVAYIAERVLTLDELRAFVDQQVATASQVGIAEAEKENHYQTVPALALRAILARRLLRQGELDEALQYFDDHTVQKIAKRYVNALRRANSRWRTSIARAEAWHEAGHIAKKKGLEIIGFELDPDNAYLEGNYSSKQWGLSAPLKTNVFTSVDETSRCYQSRAQPNLRFHYRLVAADYMLNAANLVPSSSQAFAAILCQATGWNLVQYPKQSKQLYKKYVSEGAYVPWAASFGNRCETPNFNTATTRLWAERYQNIKHQLRPYNYFIYVMIAGFIVVTLWYGTKKITGYWYKRPQK